MSINHTKPFEAHVEAARQLTASRLNNMIHVQGANAIKPGKGYRMTQTPGGITMSINPPRKIAGRKLPVDVTLRQTGPPAAPTSAVRVEDGWVSELIPGENTPAAPSCAVHKPFNILWGAEATPPETESTDRRQFDIAIGDQVSIVVYQDEEGGFGGDLAPAGGPVEIVIEPEESSGTPVSVHYNPPGGDVTTGDSGEIHYKLAVLRDIDADHASPWLEYFLAGSHIYVERDLPMLENTSTSGASGPGRVFKEYKPEDNQYKFRTIAKGGQLQVNENADDIEIRGNDKTVDLIFMQETDASPTEIGRFSFDDGLANEDENVTITIPKTPGLDGDDFNLENWPCSQDMMSPPTSPNWIIYFRKGLAYLTDPEDAVTAKKVMYDGFSCAPPDGP